MAAWVKFHEEITQGAKRALPRATRFIFMEISLKARPRRGTLDVRHDLPIVDAVHDALGGGARERRELADAWPRLTTAPEGDTPMVVVVEGAGWRRLVVPSWEAYNTVDESKTRVQRYRDKKKTTAIDSILPRGNGDVTRDDTVTSRDVSRVTSSRALRDVTLLEERRGDQKRSDSPAGSLPAHAREGVPVEPEAVAVPPEVAPVLAELEVGRDMYPDAPTAALAALAGRIVRAVRDCDEAKRDGLTAAIAAQEAVSMVRVWKGEHAGASTETLLGQVDRSVVRYVLGDCRAGRRRKAEPKQSGGGWRRDGNESGSVLDALEEERERRKARHAQRGGEARPIGAGMLDLPPTGTGGST